MRGSEEYLSWVISLIILAPVAVIIFLIYLFGTRPIVSSVSQVMPYVSTIKLTKEIGVSYIVPGISPILQPNQFMAQFYVNQSCLTYLDYLARSGILTYPTNPQTLLNSFVICIGSTNQWVYNYKNPPLANAIPPWAFSGIESLIYNSFNGEIGVLNSSRAVMSVFNLSSSSQVNQSLAYSCISLFSGKINNEYAFNYIQSLQCGSLENNFIAISNNCTSSSNSICYQVFAYMKGNPGEFQYQKCEFKNNEYLCYTNLV